MYYIIYPLLYLLSLLPFFILYGISGICAFFLCHVFSYRKEVILYNLSIAFPGKTEKERRQVAMKFYQYFTDSFIEMLKFLSISKKGMHKRATGTFDIINR